MSENLSDWLTQFHDLNPSEQDTVAETSKKEYALDLFQQVLPAIDRGDKFFYRKLSDDEKKSIVPWTLMRWISSPQNDYDQPRNLLAVNDLVNVNFSHLSPRLNAGKSGHAELQWMLLAMCGYGTVRRKFMKPARGAVKNRLEEALLKFFPHLKTDDLELLLQINTDEDLIQFFKDNGFDDKTIKEIFK